MRLLNDLSALGLLLLLWNLAVLPSHADNAILKPLNPATQLHLRITPQETRNPNSRSWFSRARNGIIQTIWRIPAHDPLSKHNNGDQTISRPPPTLLAQYGGDLVLRFEIKSIDEAEALANAVNVLFLDVWEFTPEWADIRLSRDIVPALLGLLPSSLHHAHTPLMHDLAQAIFDSYPSLAFIDPSPAPQQASRPFSHDLRPATDETNIFFRDYQPLSVIVPWMRLLRSLFPTHVRIINIGYSYEGRDIPALRVGVHPTNSDKPSEPRKTIIITGGSHAREWISTSSVNYAAYSFITAYGKSKSITKLLEEFDWIFIPTLNPDGYVYTWENDRLWRKNRQQTQLRFCRGLDLDRSYDFEWDSDSTTSNPCSESFSGENPFEGVESRRFANWARNETENNNVKVVGFLDFHSYSQQVLYPYSFSCNAIPSTLENLEELATGLAKAIRVTNGEIYGVTSACEGSVAFNSDVRNCRKRQNLRKEQAFWPRVESGGGSALDWFYHELKVPYSYQIKLRDTGSYGFLLPSQDIVPTGKEAFHAIEYLGQFLIGNKGIEGEEIEPEVAASEVNPANSEEAPEESQMVTVKANEGSGEEEEQGEEEGEELSNELKTMELRRQRR